jgi:hypothetical protein
MTYSVEISRNTEHPATWLSGYRLGINPSEDPVTNGLEPQGPVFNGWVRYRGLYATLAAAVRAVSEYVDAPHALCRSAYHDGRVVFALREPGKKSGFDGFAHNRVIARRSAHGLWISSDLEG